MNESAQWDCTDFQMDNFTCLSASFSSNSSWDLPVLFRNTSRLLCTHVCTHSPKLFLTAEEDFQCSSHRTHPSHCDWSKTFRESRGHSWDWAGITVTFLSRVLKDFTKRKKKKKVDFSPKLSFEIQIHFIVFGYYFNKYFSHPNHDIKTYKIIYKLKGRSVLMIRIRIQ